MLLSGRHDAADWRRLKDFKEGTTSVRRVNKIAIFGIFFWSALLLTGMQNIARKRKKVIQFLIYHSVIEPELLLSIFGSILHLCQ